ncbi:FctA domain-containing protein [Bifidobacterium adolescentis]|uniref:Spy0128 family protein n=1 Tax=Bifidobacterium adolescentis TaxID=1680 RepID=UPI0040649298
MAPNRFVAAVVAAVLMLVTVLIAPPAQANDTSDVPYNNHVVKNTVSPAGTSIDLFDYWVQTYHAADVNDASNQRNMGINNGKQLKFTYRGFGTAGQSVNAWTGSARPNFGIVQNTLVNGYPQLKAGNQYDSGKTTDGTQSLDYLFDPASTDPATQYRKTYTNLKGLLQLENGYYTYDSAKNFAALVTDTNGDTDGNNQVVLYDTPSVGFFPLNNAGELFTEQNGQLTKSVTGARNAVLNHYFGVHSQSDFMQPINGLVNGEDMTFDFTGDDDVWVFVDGVLVGDVGGIHNTAALNINYRTGAVTVSDGRNSQYKKTTIRQAFVDAYGEDSDAFKSIEWSLTSPNTFADGSYHTLDFFYLERGNNESNMKLKFNLADIPENNLVKLDQQGNRVAGAGFELYKAGSDYSYTAAGLISKGVTDKDGVYRFTNYETGKPVNFADLACNGRGITHYVLKETSAPPGYRKSEDIDLRYQISPNGEGLLLCNRETHKWNDGAWSVAHETLTLANGTTVYDMNGNVHDASRGKVFAVILNRHKTAGGTLRTDEWNAVTGSALQGWNLSESKVDGVESVVELAQSDAGGSTNYLHFLGKDSEGKYSTYIPSLPGDLFTYYFMRSKADQADSLYAMGLYYTTADTAAGITAENTIRLDMDDSGEHSDQFMRSFGVQIAVTDVRNAPIVQKVDDAGNPIEGATFGLYAANQVSADGKSLLEGATPLQTCVTKDTDYPYHMDGSCMFAMKGSVSEGVEGSGVDLGNGTYYIKEIKAPGGYEINDTLAKVLINDTGIYADAGGKNDGISTLTHIGTLNEVFKQFAANRNINRTLSDLRVTQLRCADEQCVTGNGWSKKLDGENEKAVNVTWTGDFADGYYTLANQSTMTDDGFVNDTGWTNFSVAQSPDTATSSRGARFELRNSELSHLFTGATVVRVQDQRKGSLSLTKKVTVGEGYTAPDDMDTRAFTFGITLRAKDAATLQQDGKTDHYYGVISGGTGKGAVSDQSVVLKLERASADATSGQLVRCVAKGDTDEAKCGTTEPVKLTNRQTLTIANIADGVSYSIVENNLPTGYTLDQKKTVGLSGTITRASGTAQATAVNLYQPDSITMKASDFIQVRKTVTGLPAGTTGDYPFSFQLQASQDTPLPSCATDGLAGACVISNVDANGNHTMTKTLTYRASAGASQDMAFGDITFTKPGTYTYQLSEVMPATGALEGFNYSRAQYTVSVTVSVAGGKLQVSKATATKTTDDSGAAVTDSASEDPAEFINNYSKDPRAVTFSATKDYTENGYPYQAGMFSTRLAAVGSFVTAKGNPSTVAGLPNNANTVPMPTGVGTAGTDASFDDYHTANFPRVSFDGNTGNNTYVYKVTENTGTVQDAGTAMTYDDTAYYVFVAVTVTDGMVHANITYYKDVSGTLRQVAVPTDGSNAIRFTNTYQASEVSATPQGTKTLTGRARKAADSFSFTLKAGDDATRDAVESGTVVGASCASGTGCTPDGTLAKATTTNVTAASGEAKSFDFTKLTFRKAGTYVFDISETEGTTGGITYDGHTSTVTYVVSDMNASGKHTGKLRVQNVAYGNRSALTDADRKATDAAAFTNTYSASLQYAGFDVTKELNNSNTGGSRALYAGEFTFRISGTDDASEQRIAAATFANDREFSNGSAEPTENGGRRAKNVMQNKLSDLVFTEADAGKTYEFKIVELAQHTNPNTGKTNTEPDADYKAPTSAENASDVKIDGVWCKQWAYYVRIAVTDKGDGTLGVTSTLSCYKGRNAGTKYWEQTVNGNTKVGNTKANAILFTNTYEKLNPTVVTNTADSAPLYKQLAGRAWSNSSKDRFTFTLERCNYSANLGSFSDANSISCAADSTTLNTLPQPSRGASVTVGKSDLVHTKAGDFARIGFGEFSFSKPGAYVYKVTEVAGSDATLSYAANVRYLRFRVEEDQMKGVYSVIATTPGYDAPTATDENDGAAFVNVCRSAEQLPLTGGLTTRNFLIGGGIIGLLAVIAGFAVHEWWLRQKRKEQLIE